MLDIIEIPFYEEKIRKEINSKFKVCHEKFYSWATPEGDCFKSYLNGVEKEEGEQPPADRLKFTKLSELADHVIKSFLSNFKYTKSKTIYWRQFPTIKRSQSFLNGSYQNGFVDCYMRCLVKEN